MNEQVYYKSKPNGKIIIMWASRILLGLFVTGIAILLVIIPAPISMPLSVILVPIPILGLFGLYLIYALFLWKSYHYSITNKGIYLKGGIFNKKEKFVPFFKITNVEKSQSLLEQILRISTLSFQTAGTGGMPMPEISFGGLVDADIPKKLAYKFIEQSQK